tara:strand:+ start:334 stop:573 length:240 start_codon:yes stop_codon:yes gene_type:complete
MKIYLVSQNSYEYDTFDSMVVAAKDEDEARDMHPYGFSKDDWGLTECWVRYEDRDKLIVSVLGNTRLKKGVILASFNAG